MGIRQLASVPMTGNERKLERNKRPYREEEDHGGSCYEVGVAVILDKHYIMLKNWNLLSQPRWLECGRDLSCKV
jgi:hypothetical protein